jgi:hypothetical protein
MADLFGESAIKIFKKKSCSKGNKMDGISEKVESTGIILLTSLGNKN